LVRGGNRLTAAREAVGCKPADGKSRQKKRDSQQVRGKRDDWPVQSMSA
jgi:hypothetical protein